MGQAAVLAFRVAIPLQEERREVQTVIGHRLC